MHSSMIGQATQLVPKSAANRVIRFGRYCFSRRTQGRIGMGTLGVSEKTLGSNQKKTASRSSVVAKISTMKVPA